SYKGQIVTMTAPLIGNYGVVPEDAEAEKPWVEGFVCREVARVPSNFRSAEDLSSYLARTGVVGIEGIDTRAITKKLREKGALRGYVTTAKESDATLVDRARAVPPMEGRDLVLE